MRSLIEIMNSSSDLARASYEYGLRVSAEADHLNMIYLMNTGTSSPNGTKTADADLICKFVPLLLQQTINYGFRGAIRSNNHYTHLAWFHGLKLLSVWGQNITAHA